MLDPRQGNLPNPRRRAPRQGVILDISRICATSGYHFCRTGKNHASLRHIVSVSRVPRLGGFGLMAQSGRAATLDFTPSGLQTGTINGALFEEIDPSYPAGSGVIDSFVRIQQTGSAGPEQGYNTDARPVQFDEKTDSVHTHTIRLADLQPVTIGGVEYYQFLLDINEPNGGTKSLLSLTQLQVFASSQGDLGASGKLYDSISHDFGALATKLYDMNAGGAGRVLLDDTNAGSGRADMVFSVPVSAFAGLDPATTSIYLFSHFGDVIGGESGYQDQGGFEEWAARLRRTPRHPLPPRGDADSRPTPGISLVKMGVFVPAGADPATVSNVFGIARNFNALILEAFRAENGDTEGRLAVAGNATILGSYGVGMAGRGHEVPPSTDGSTDRLIVGGDFADGDWGVNGNIVCGGVRTGPERHFPNGNVFRHKTTITFDDNGNVPADDSGEDFDTIRAEMMDSSDELGSCADRGVVKKDVSLPSQADFVGNDPAQTSSTSPPPSGAAPPARSPSPRPLARRWSSTSTDRPSRIANCGMQLTGVDLEHVVYNYVDAAELRTTNFTHLGSVLAPHASCEFIAGSSTGSPSSAVASMLRTASSSTTSSSTARSRFPARPACITPSRSRTPARCRSKTSRSTTRWSMWRETRSRSRPAKSIRPRSRPTITQRPRKSPPARSQTRPPSPARQAPATR